MEKSVDESVEIFNREHEGEHPLNVAGGYEIFDAKEDRNINETVRRAA